jgi:hypothetical protein
MAPSWLLNFLKSFIVGTALDVGIVWGLLAIFDSGKSSDPVSIAFGVVILWVLSAGFYLRSGIRAVASHFLWGRITTSAVMQSMRTAGYPRDVTALDWSDYFQKISASEETPREVVSGASSFSGMIAATYRHNAIAGMCLQSQADAATRKYLDSD